MHHWIPRYSALSDFWGTSAKIVILMTSHYPDLGKVSDWLKQICLAPGSG